MLSTLTESPWRSALRGYDNTFNYLWLRSAMVDRDWDFRNDLEACNTLTPPYKTAALNLPLTSTGHIPNKYGIGWSVATLPFYLLADGVVWLGRALGVWNFSNDGYNVVYQVAIQLGHALLSVLSILLAIRVVRSWLGEDVPAAAGVLTIWASSSLLYYQTSNLSMSHGLTFFAVTLGVWALTQAGKSFASSAWWLLAGFGFGLAAVTRFQAAVFGLFAVWAIWPFLREKNWRAAIRSAGLLGMGATPLLLLQLWAWRVVYGQWLVFSYGVEGEGFNWSNPALGSSLFSPWHGLYYWHPLLVVGTGGLLMWAWRRRGVAFVAAGIFALVFYINSAWWCWWLGSAFGNRAFDAALLPLMAGQAFWFGRFGSRGRTLLWIICGLLTAWNFYVLLLYRSGAIPRDAPVTWSEMSRAAERLPSAMGF